MTTVLPLLALFSTILLLFGMILLHAVAGQAKLAARVRGVQRSLDLETLESAAVNPIVRVILLMGRSLLRSRLLSVKTTDQVNQTLAAAGIRRPDRLALFVGTKLGLLIMMPVVGWLACQAIGLSPVLHGIGSAVAAIFGILLPEYAVRSSRRRFLKRLDCELPDALDMMVICTEAGLGLESAIQRVASEMEFGFPAISAELQLTSNELQMTSDRRLALLGLGNRTGLDSLKRLGGTLLQTLHYGTPISQALRALAVEMRGETLVRFEERAARLPVLLTLPMIVFILPTVFVIVGGPAMLRVLASFRG